MKKISAMFFAVLVILTLVCPIAALAHGPICPEGDGGEMIKQMDEWKFIRGDPPKFDSSINKYVYKYVYEVYAVYRCNVNSSHVDKLYLREDYKYEYTNP